MIKTDRSRIVAYRNCPRLRWLGYEWDGTGLETTHKAEALHVGLVVHEAIAGMLGGEALDLALAGALETFTDGLAHDAPSHYVREQSALVEGLIRTWHLHLMPALLEQYEVVSVEREWPWMVADDLMVMLRRDAVLRDKSDGSLVVFELKTASTISDDYVKQWRHSGQVLCYVAATEAQYQEPVSGVLFHVLAKGRYMKDDGATSDWQGQRIQQSPFCYAYKVNDLLQTKWAAKGRKVFVPDHMELAEWLPLLDPAKLVLVHLEPGPTTGEIERWTRQTARQEYKLDAVCRGLREHEMTDAVRESQMDKWFPLNDDHCLRFWGHPCPFEGLCFCGEVEVDPLGSGLYQRRVPHHTLELDAGEDV
jgi:hypothetical protein